MLLVFNISICLLIVRLAHVVCRWMREFFVLCRLNCPISVMEGVPYQRCPYCGLKNPSVYSQLIKQVLLYIKKFARVIRACTDLLIKVYFFLFQTWPNSPRDSLQTCTRSLSRYTVVFCSFILGRSLFSLPPSPFGAGEDGKKRDAPNNVMVAFDKEEGTWPIRIFPLGWVCIWRLLWVTKNSRMFTQITPKVQKCYFYDALVPILVYTILKPGVEFWWTAKWQSHAYSTVCVRMWF